MRSREIVGSADFRRWLPQVRDMVIAFSDGNPPVKGRDLGIFVTMEGSHSVIANVEIMRAAARTHEPAQGPGAHLRERRGFGLAPRLRL